MIDIRGDMWTVTCDALCITTNGFVKNNGSAVMGRGCAKQAAQLLPFLPDRLGQLIRTNGNNVQILHEADATALVSFPVKPEGGVINSMDDIVQHMQSRVPSNGWMPGWAWKADLSIIERSAQQLVALANQRWPDPLHRIVLPRPGCGAGELDWQQVRPMLKHYLDDRFAVITY